MRRNLCSSIGRGIQTIDVSTLCDAAASLPDRLATARALSSAFSSAGFAVVVGHGVSSVAVEGLRDAARGFFQQPVGVKERYDLGKGYGYGGYVQEGRENGAQLLGDFSRPADLVESLTLRGLTVGATSSTDGQSGLAPPRMGFGGLTKGSEALPATVIEPARRFVCESRALSKALADALHLSSLGVDPSEIEALVDVDAAGCRLAHYPAQRHAPPQPGQLRYGAHVDSGGVTVLSLDPTNPHGLQVDLSHRGTQAEEGERMWVDVPYVPDALVCNVGALLSRWTAGQWRASVHRILTADVSRPRVSLVTNALAPRPDAPAVAGFSSCFPSGAVAEPVDVSTFLTRRVALHRTEYKLEHGLSSEEALAAERARVQALDV